MGVWTPDSSEEPAAAAGVGERTGAEQDPRAGAIPRPPTACEAMADIRGRTLTRLRRGRDCSGPDSAPTFGLRPRLSNLHSAGIFPARAFCAGISAIFVACGVLVNGVRRSRSLRTVRATWALQGSSLVRGSCLVPPLRWALEAGHAHCGPKQRVALAGEPRAARCIGGHAFVGLGRLLVAPSLRSLSRRSDGVAGVGSAGQRWMRATDAGLDVLWGGSGRGVLSQCPWHSV